MFVINGMVYGGMPESPIKINAVKPLEDMIMILTFSNGEQRLFDASCLIGPAFEPLKNPDVFRNISLEHGIPTWMNGEIDCAPEYMYNHSFEYSVTPILEKVTPDIAIL